MLTAFVKVADRASVSRAALDLGVGKSVVSKRVAQLEELIGATRSREVHGASRSRRPVRPTPISRAARWLRWVPARKGCARCDRS